MKVILEEVNIESLHKEDMQMILRNFIMKSLALFIFWNKKLFHPELNPIERVWAQSKVYTSIHFPPFVTIPVGLDSVSLERLETTYFQGFVAGARRSNKTTNFTKVGVNSCLIFSS